MSLPRQEKPFSSPAGECTCGEQESHKTIKEHVSSFLGYQFYLVAQNLVLALHKSRIAAVRTEPNATLILELRQTSQGNYELI